MHDNVIWCLTPRMEKWKHIWSCEEVHTHRQKSSGSIWALQRLIPWVKGSSLGNPTSLRLKDKFKQPIQYFIFAVASSHTDETNNNQIVTAKLKKTERTSTFYSFFIFYYICLSIHMYYIYVLIWWQIWFTFISLSISTINCFL